MNFENGNVIRIIDEYSILINLGKNDDVRKGKKLEVFEPGEMIIDPLSKEELGSLDYIKDTLEVVNVYDNFSTCQHIDVEEVTVGLAAFASPLERTKTKRTIKTLNVNKTEINPMKVHDKIIKIGDPIRFVN